MWIHLLRRIQPEINSLVNEEDAKRLDEIVKLLANTEALLSDVKNEKEGFLRSGRLFLGNLPYIQSLVEAISIGRELTAAELMYLSHLASLYKLLEDSMEEFQVTIFRDDVVRDLITNLYQSVEHVPFQQAFERIIVGWDNEIG